MATNGCIRRTIMSQTPEVRLMKEIQLWCGQHNFIAFHTNVGKIKFWDKVQQKERYFDTGLPPPAGLTL